MNTKEIVALTEKWLNELKQLAIQYNNAINDLATVRQDYENQKKTWYNTILPYVMPLITIIILLLSFGITLRYIGCPNPIDIKFQDLELTQHCKK